LVVLSLFALLYSASAACADVKPAPLFSDHVVLQSGMPVPIWGTASAGGQVTVTLNGQKQPATTGQASQPPQTINARVGRLMRLIGIARSTILSLP
jgi:sialate O-acetylesterase